MWKGSVAGALILAGVLAGLPQRAVASPTYGQLMNALKNESAEADKFRGMMGNLTAAQFQVADVSTVVGSGGNQASFETALKKDAGQVSGLRDTLSHTTLTGNDGIVELLSTMLKKQNLSVDRVVAIDIQGNQITLFYQ